MATLSINLCRFFVLAFAAGSVDLFRGQSVLFHVIRELGLLMRSTQIALSGLDLAFQLPQSFSLSLEMLPECLASSGLSRG